MGFVTRSVRRCPVLRRRTPGPPVNIITLITARRQRDYRHHHQQYDHDPLPSCPSRNLMQQLNLDVNACRCGLPCQVQVQPHDDRPVTTPCFTHRSALPRQMLSPWLPCKLQARLTSHSVSSIALSVHTTQPDLIHIVVSIGNGKRTRPAAERQGFSPKAHDELTGQRDALLELLRW
jgi:hypothetical protein